MARIRIRNATDLGIDLDLIAARRAPREWIYLDGVRPWEREEDDLARAGYIPCPACGGLPLPASRYCSRCDRAGLDGLAKYPGLPIDTRPNPDYPETRGRRWGGGKLKGGTGR